MAKPKSEDFEKLTFEECLERLQHVVHSLEDGSTGLSESLVEYERGVRYLKRCHELLETAEQKVQLLSGTDSEGKPVTHRFDDEATSLEEKAASRSRRRTRKAKSETGDGKGVVDDGATLF